LNGASLSITEKQKIGVVGRNGAGKSTLFKIIIGEEEKDFGTVHIHNHTKIGYLTQHDPYEPNEKVMDYLKRISNKEEWQCAKLAGAFQLKNELLNQSIGSLSGGYQMRVKLAGILLHEPNLLLLDEPTNYLDLSTLILLEEWLKRYRGSYLIISHDREFLKNTCTETMEIDHGKITLYPRTIEDYLAHKEAQISMVQKYNKNIEREKKHLQSFVDRFSASKATQAQSKIKQIARLKTIDIVHPMKTSRIRIPRVEERKGTALTVKHMTIGYGEKTVATDINLHIERGEHIAIVGDNGQGKTTFLKTIAEELPKLSGTFRWGPHISIGYYAQHVPSMLLPYEQVLTYLERMAPPETKSEEILRMAGNFLFHGDDVKKSISVLSGGEKARLCLAGLLIQKNSVLLLDEPTNHLDFETVEALASALSEANCTILFISHNRTFVSVLAHGIIEVNNGQVIRYPHNYDEYVYHLAQTLGADTAEEQAEEPTPEIVALSKLERDERRKELKKAKRKLQEIEYELMDLEKEKTKLLAWFEHHPTEYSREKTEVLKATEENIAKKEKQWLDQQAMIEAMEKIG
jgi:ATP-binding cassette subfamily F protein 3